MSITVIDDRVVKTKNKVSVDSFIAVDNMQSAVLFADALSNEQAHIIDDFSTACLGFFKYLTFKLDKPKKEYAPVNLIADVVSFETLCIKILEDDSSHNEKYIFDDDWDIANSKLLQSNFSKKEIEDMVALTLGGIYTIQTLMHSGLPNLAIKNKVLSQIKSKYGHLKNNLAIKTKTS